MGRPSQKSEGLVLRTVDYGEADRIVTLLTIEHGLQRGFARSARKSRKRFGASLEPFSKSVFLWTQGRGDLLSFQGADLLDGHFNLRQNIHCVGLCSYAVELVEMLLEEGEASVQVYQLLSAFLAYLNSGGSLETARLLFELRLVSMLGYIPHLLHCSECLHVFGEEKIAFDVDRGGSLCLNCAGKLVRTSITVGTVGSLSRSLRVSHEVFDGFRFGQRTISEARFIFDQTLKSLLPREPKSLKFLAQLSPSDS